MFRTIGSTGQFRRTRCKAPRPDGGIASGADAVAKFDAGASLLQFYTGMVYRGPGLIGECVEALRACA